MICLLVVSCATSCGAPENDDTLDMVYDPCAGVTVSAPNATEEELGSVRDALDLWIEAGKLNLTLGADDHFPLLPVTFEVAPRAQYGVYDDERGLVFINRGLRGNPRVITIAHELGHAFGLLHVRGVSSLMNEHNHELGPTAADVTAVRSLWPSCSGGE